MRSLAKFVYPGIAILGILAVLVWSFPFFASDSVPMGQLEKELGRSTLTAQEEERLNEFASHCQKTGPQQAAAVILNQRFQFRGIFQKLLQHALFSKLKPEADKASENLAIAAAIAQVYRDSLADGFLMNEFHFSNNLTTAQLRRKLEADYFFNKGMASFSQSDSAVYYFKKSLRLSRQIGDEKRTADNLLMWQYALYQKGAYEDALKIGEELLEIVRRTGYLHREAGALYNIGQIHIESGEVRKALDCFERALAIHRNLGNKHGELQLLGRIGIVSNRLGHFSEALDFFNRALELSSELNYRAEELRVLNDRGHLFKNMGDYGRAKKDYYEALAIAEKQKDGPNKAAVLNNLGILYRILGDYERSFDALWSALAIDKAQGNPYDVARTLKNVGDVYRDEDSLKQAQEHFKDALEKIKKNAEIDNSFKPQRLEAEILLSIGDIEGEQDNWSAALERYQHAIFAFKTIGFKEGIAAAVVRAGNASREMNNPEKALEHFREAIAVADSLEDPLHQINALYGAGLVYRDKNEFASAEQFFARAIRMAETTRIHAQSDDRISYFATIQNLFDEMIILQRRQGNDEAAFAYSERARARAFLDIFLEKEHATKSRPAKSLLPLSLKEIQSFLDENIIVIEYRVTSDHLVAFVIDHQSFTAIDIPVSRQELRQEVLGLRETIEKTDPESYENFRRSAKRLYTTLIEPFQSQFLAGKQVYFIPDDILYSLPFAALVASDNGAEKFLVEQYAIAYAPSATILRHGLDRAKPLISKNQLKFFAVGNPVGDLKYAQAEVREISSRFYHPDTLIGAEIHEDQVLQSMHKKFNVLHFATHAFINNKSPAASYLVVGRENGETLQNHQESRRGNDGRLTAYEVYELNLSEAQLVTLSACHTSGGRFFRGEGVVGFTHAFMKAGTSSIMTTQWDVVDKYTKEIMTLFYDNWINQKMTKAQALREAQQKTIMKMTKRNVTHNLPYPHAWAAFTLIGDYR